MKYTSENIKNYLKYTHKVLGISHIFQSISKSIEIAIPDANRKKVFNFYYWPTNKDWTEFLIDDPQNPGKFQTLFVFYSVQNDFLVLLQNQSELIAKMNQALGGSDQSLLVGWLSPNAERDLFSALACWKAPLKVVLFRDEAGAHETIYMSGVHSILETVSPLKNPNDQTRKRHIWNDFKRWMASLSG